MTLDWLRNWHSGLKGVAFVVVVTGTVYFIAFMTAFGNPTTTARSTLRTVEVFFRVANPLYTLPLAYLAGAYLGDKMDTKS